MLWPSRPAVDPWRDAGPQALAAHLLRQAYSSRNSNQTMNYRSWICFSHKCDKLCFSNHTHTQGKKHFWIPVTCQDISKANNGKSKRSKKQLIISFLMSLSQSERRCSNRSFSELWRWAKWHSRSSHPWGKIKEEVNKNHLWQAKRIITYSRLHFPAPHFIPILKKKNAYISQNMG